MGLDSVEIVMDVEEEFCIRIPDRDAERIFTVGGLANYVESRLRGDAQPKLEIPAGRCESARAFYALRKALISTVGVARRSVRPSSRLRDILPRKLREEYWLTLERAGVRAPPLRSSAIAGWLLVALSGLTGAWLCVAWHPLFILLWIPAACWLAVVTLRALSPGLPAHCLTVGDLATHCWCEPMEFENGESVTELLARELVRQRINAIVSEVVGIPADQLHDGTRFSDICD